MHPIPKIVSRRRRRRASGTIVALTGLALLGLCAEGGAAPTRSTSIALTGNGTRLVNVNHEADSVTLFDVRGGGQRLRKVAEVPVGQHIAWPWTRVAVTSSSPTAPTAPCR